LITCLAANQRWRLPQKVDCRPVVFIFILDVSFLLAAETAGDCRQFFLKAFIF